MGKSQIVYGKDGELEEIVSVAGDVFGVDFPGLLPRLYGKNAHTEAYHHLVREDGEIKAIVCSFPYDLYVGGRHLKANGIGTVSVTRDRRGCGYMIDLMNDCLSEMNRDGVDISVLGGQRQRYGHFGYALLSDCTEFTVTDMNLRHAEDTSVHKNLKSVEADKYPDAAEILYGMHIRQKIYAHRPKNEFMDISVSGFGKVMLLFDGTVPVGYYILGNSGNSVTELFLEDGYTAEDFVRHAVPLYNNSITVSIGEYRYDIYKYLYLICDNWTSGGHLNANVLNYKNVIEAYTDLKMTYTHIPDGEFTVAVTDRGTYRITVKNGKCTVDECDGKYADITLSHINAQEMMFSSATGLYQDKLTPFAKMLFPIPLYFPATDKV